MKRTKTKTKSGEEQRKGRGNKEPRVIILEGSQEIENTSEIRDETIDTKEKSGNEEIKEPEAVLSDQSEKEFTKTDVVAEVIKEGETRGNSEEESDSEEGEIEMITPRKKKTKGRKSKK